MTQITEKCDHLGSALDQLRQRLTIVPDISSRDQDIERLRTVKAWNSFIASRGRRYLHSTFANFRCDHPGQSTAVSELHDYAKSMTDNIQSGSGLVIFGPRGTGKDHLAVAVAREVVQSGLTVRWINGMDLFGIVRDAMDREKSTSEASIVNDFANQQILYISDPIPPIGKLTDWQISTIFRILDRRYSNCRPTWITLNVASSLELDDRIGPQNSDRIRDGALAVFTNWPSFRSSRKDGQ